MLGYWLRMLVGADQRREMALAVRWTWFGVAVFR